MSTRFQNLAKLFIGLVLVLSTLAFLGCPTDDANGNGANGNGPEPPKGTLVMADLDWDSAQIHNRIAAFILEHGYNYEIEYIYGSTIPLFVGLAQGDIDISMEIWVENQQEAYLEAVGAGKVVDLGGNFLDNWQGWLVPTYMIDDGLLPADISVDNIGQYWELFQDPEDPDKGRFYSCIIGWACELINAEKMQVYGLDQTFNVFEPGSGTALLTSMVSAYEQHEPWFGYYWSPTPALGKYDMTVVSEPAFDTAVWENNHGCGFPAVTVDIVVNADLLTRAPEVIEFLQAYDTDAAMTNAALAFYDDVDASTTEAALMEAAEWFLGEYEDVWTEWVPADVAAKVRAAL